MLDYLPIMELMKIAIIGAGPAGIYTALLLEKFKGEVHLFEQNKDIGEKLKTTGGGRMNVTNRVLTEQQFTSHQQRWVDRLFKNPHFENRYTILEELGIEYQWEKNRAILKSQDAVAEVARLKARILGQDNVILRLGAKVGSIIPLEEGFSIRIGESEEFFDRVVITTGGMYRMKDMGGTDHIYSIPKALGHEVTAVQPSLCPLIFVDKPLREFKGISFVGVLKDLESKKSVTDDLILTHFGISGPAALDFSSMAGEKTELSFVSSVSEEEFVKAFNLAREGKNSIKKFLKTYIPGRLVEYHLERAEIDQDFMSDIPKKKLQMLVKSLFHYALPPRQKNVYPGSWTTKGGVDITQIETKNLQSKLVPGVYFAGEVLDCDGLCGGFNISFSMVSAQIVSDDLMKMQRIK